MAISPDWCRDLAHFTCRKINALVVEFVRELGGWDALPAGFDVRSAGWREAEDRIDAAVASGDVRAVLDACLDYETRAAKYLQAWRELRIEKLAA